MTDSIERIGTTMRAFPRLLGTVTLAAVVAVSASATLSGNAGADSASATHSRRGGHGQIYFFARPSSAVALVGQHLPSPNPLVLRPSGFPLFEDGQWVLEKLHWSEWGSPVARARGLSSSSNDDPNAAEGKRIITWAKVRLSQPGVFRGHRVYRCITITVPRPAHYPPACLQRRDRYIGLMAPGSGEPVGVPGGGSKNRRLKEFSSPDRHVTCFIGTPYIGGAPAACFAYRTKLSGPELSAWIQASGEIHLCNVLKPSLSEVCFQNWVDDLPVLAYGQSSELNGIRCTSASDGITCQKVSGAGKGHGFRINRDEAVEIGS
jgi:hypothetical protein